MIRGRLSRLHAESSPWAIAFHCADRREYSLRRHGTKDEDSLDVVFRDALVFA